MFNLYKIYNNMIYYDITFIPISLHKIIKQIPMQLMDNMKNFAFPIIFHNNLKMSS